MSSPIPRIEPFDYDEGEELRELVERYLRHDAERQRELAGGLTRLYRARVLEALPTAADVLLGLVVLVRAYGAADDQAYLCIQESGGAYAWRELDFV